MIDPGTHLHFEVETDQFTTQGVMIPASSFKKDYSDFGQPMIRKSYGRHSARHLIISCHIPGHIFRLKQLRRSRGKV